MHTSRCGWSWPQGPSPEPHPGTRALLTVDIQHHLPEGRPDRLMESKPHLSAPSQRIGAALRCREEGAAHGGVPAMGASSGGASRHAPCRCPTRGEHVGEHPPRAEGTWPSPAFHFPWDPPTSMPCLQPALHTFLGWRVGRGRGSGDHGQPAGQAPPRPQGLWR